MRKFLPLLLILANTGHADQIDRAMAIAGAVNLPVTWVNDNGDAVPSVQLDLTAPGHLVLSRQKAGESKRSYALEAEGVYNPPVQTPLRIKSTTCRGMPAQISCHLVSDVRIVEFTLRPLDGGPRLEPLILTNASVNRDVGRAAFPELVAGSAATLFCDDWSWAKNPRTDAVEIQDLGVVFDQTVKDTNSTLSGNSHISGQHSCKPRPDHGCNLLPPTESSYIKGLVLNVAQISWYVELNEANGRDCTVEFQGGNDEITGLIVNRQYTKHGTHHLSPADRARIESRLTPALGDIWSRSQFVTAFDDPTPFETLDPADQVAVVKSPWLKMFNVITDSQISSSYSNETNVSTKELKHTTDIKERP